MSKQPPRPQFINVDLDVRSERPLRWLVNYLAEVGAHSIANVKEGDVWLAVLELDRQPSSAASGLRRFVSMLESAPQAIASRLASSCKAELNIGYYSGIRPPAVSHHLDSRMLGRLSSLGVSLRVTVYSAPSRLPSVALNVVVPE